MKMSKSSEFTLERVVSILGDTFVQLREISDNGAAFNVEMRHKASGLRISIAHMKPFPDYMEILCARGEVRIRSLEGWSTFVRDMETDSDSMWMD